MAQKTPSADGEPVEEGDKIEIEGEDGVYVVTWVGISTKAEPAGETFGMSERVKFEDGELEEKIESGDVTVPSDTDPVTAAGREIVDHVDIEELVEALEGRSGLRTSKPDADGLTQFIWRRARFHGGHDTCLPVMANSWLQDYLDAHDVDAKVTGVMDDAGEEVTSELEKAVDAVLVAFDENPAAAAQRWQKAGAF